jgi:tyrosinase
MKKVSILVIITYLKFSAAYYDEEKKIHVRKNVKDMTYEEWDIFKKAFAEMMFLNGKENETPNNYEYQANIHGWKDYDITNKLSIEKAEKFNWHMCQHGQNYFLPWHRMYLYYFERFLRKNSRNLTTTIPYWDYYDREQQVLPEPFRIPANPAVNSLYVKERCPDINNGQPLPMEILDHFPALGSKFFSVNKIEYDDHVCLSFGGKETSENSREKNFDLNGPGILEQMPHNQIHLFVGGPNGFMSDNCQASRDPIFWVHHAQIDRIWESWLRANPNHLKESEWLNHNFTWVDITGDKVNRSIKEFLNITQLGYTYDNYIEPETKFVSNNDEIPHLQRIADEKIPNKLVFNDKHRSILLPLDSKAYKIFKDLSEEPMNSTKIKISLHINIKNIMPTMVFDMYINLPNETKTNEWAPYFVRPIVVLNPDCNKPVSEPRDLKFNICYDVTKNLKRILKNQMNHNNFIHYNLNITFVPKGCGAHNINLKTQNWIVFNRIHVMHYNIIQTMKIEPSPSSRSASEISPDSITKFKPNLFNYFLITAFIIGLFVLKNP